MTAYASSFDTVGIVSKSISDTSTLYAIMKGKDEHDQNTSLTITTNNNENYGFGYLDITGLNIQNEVKECYSKFVAMLKGLASMASFPLPLEKQLLPTYYTLTMAEASSNLSRYGGVTYGERKDPNNSLSDMYTKSRTEGFGTEVKKRIMLGNFILSEGAYEQYFQKAELVRELIKKEVNGLLNKHEFLALPTCPSTAFTLATHRDSISMYSEDLFTVLASICGLPAISIPFGFDNENLPIGMQIIGRKGDENRLFEVTHQLQGQF